MVRYQHHHNTGVTVAVVVHVARRLLAPVHNAKSVRLAVCAGPSRGGCCPCCVNADIFIACILLHQQLVPGYPMRLWVQMVNGCAPNLLVLSSGLEHHHSTHQFNCSCPYSAALAVAVEQVSVRLLACCFSRASQLWLIFCISGFRCCSVQFLFS